MLIYITLKYLNRNRNPLNSNTDSPTAIKIENSNNMKVTCGLLSLINGYKSSYEDNTTKSPKYRAYYIHRLIHSYEASN
jgi:hypothetical protein